MQRVGGSDVKGAGGAGVEGVNAVIATMCRLQEQARAGSDGTYLGNENSL